MLPWVCTPPASMAQLCYQLPGVSLQRISLRVLLQPPLYFLYLYSGPLENTRFFYFSFYSKHSLFQINQPLLLFKNKQKKLMTYRYGVSILNGFLSIVRSNTDFSGIRGCMLNFLDSILANQSLNLDSRVKSCLALFKILRLFQCRVKCWARRDINTLCQPLLKKIINFLATW